ncbi:ribosomal-protein-alanine N-acetyltransferase [Marinospirillum celere]|uniref:Ribosomal-protein-alanine N-acetyltransferase n=1 Tax=Marinospirillum celere TaxID=1122252 RepID=A0A1I1HXR0_9GAMM|nr:GNAT family N-acetyltransferase [Marinospirillum celere]SFC28666.1 ribosomal-protein-alanine N-acetyltransferase [Marinospirillum celere]
MSDSRLRVLNEDDLAPLLELAASDPQAWQETGWLASLQQDEVWGLHAAAGELQAALVLGWGYLEAEVLYVLVAPQFRRQGLAKQLLKQAIFRAQQEKAERLLLEVRASNQAACLLYQHLGFALDGRRKGYYTCQSSPTGREDALLMSLQLQT